MPSTASATARRGGWPADLGLAVVLGGVGVLGTLHAEATDAHTRAVDAGALTLVGVAAIGVLLWRRRPGVGCGLGMLATCAYTARGYAGGPIYLLGAVTVFGLALVLDRRRGYALAAVVGTALFVASVAGRRAFQWNDLLFFVWPVVPVLVAEAVRGRRERAAAEAERAEEERRRRDSEASRRRAEERLALARDLHDSVAHAMATINVQAGVAAHVMERDPSRTADALEAIRLASRDVLDELRVMLDVLREGERAPVHPVADLAQLEQLVTSSRRAGVAVDLRRGPVDGVPPPVSAAAYRVVQEGLTNVARHAPGARATVVVERPSPAALVVEVVDDGSGSGGPPPAGPGEPSGTGPGSGLGLLGVRERAEVTGGRCEIGARPDGGFRLRVVWDGLR